MPQIFLSYPRESQEFVNLIVEYLKSQGVAALWIDTAEIRPGHYIGPRLQEAIRAASCCVFVLNTFSRDSPWCMAEVGAFWGASKPIIVYATDPRCELPSFLAGIRPAENLVEVAAACQTFSRQAAASSIDDSLLAALREGGLRHAFRIPLDDHHREDRVQQLVDDERKRPDAQGFRLLASSGYNYLHPNGKVWRAGLGDAIIGGEVDLVAVLESPFSPFALTRALANDVTFHHWNEKLPLGVLLDLDRHSNIEIRVTDHPVNCSLFFNSASVFYDPYLWARPGAGRRTENNFWVFEFEYLPDSPQDCYALLSRHFDFLVRQSIPIADFLRGGEEGYDRRGREFKETVERLRQKEKV